jgi:ferredoxin-NADP reductase
MTSVLHDAEKGAQGRDATARPPIRELLVRSMTWEAEGVLSLELVDPSGVDLPEWAPGAHVDIDFGLVGQRQYSLCSEAADRRRWRVAVLHEEEGRGGSAYVHTLLRPGSVLAVRGPKNTFPLIAAAEYLFVAGGIGITPILPMLAEVRRMGAPWRLLYGGRRRASMAFLDRLGQHERVHGPAPSRVTVWPQDERGLLDLDAALAGLGAGGAVFACGPEPLLAALDERCAQREVRLHVERFAAKPRRDARPTGFFEVECRRSARTFTVGAGESIVQAAERAGLNPVYSCLDGVCGTCETAVLAGEPDHRDSILSDEEQQAGDTMLICVSRCRGERLVLDL